MKKDLQKVISPLRSMNGEEGFFILESSFLILSSLLLYLLRAIWIVLSAINVGVILISSRSEGRVAIRNVFGISSAN